MTASLNKLQTSAYKKIAVLLSDITSAHALVAGSTIYAGRWISQRYSLPLAVSFSWKIFMLESFLEYVLLIISFYFVIVLWVREAKKFAFLHVSAVRH
jgi:hypothetical protein